MRNLKLLVILVFAVSCTKKMYIAPGKVSCNMPDQMTCFLVKKDIEDNWILSTENIIGFDYQPGYQYRVKVKGDKVEDELGIRRKVYKVVEVLEKVDKKKGKTTASQNKSNSTRDAFSLIEFTSNQSEIGIPDEEITMIWNKAKSEISGFAGCNSYYGSINIYKEDSVAIGPLGATKKMCADKSVAAFESDFLKALESTTQLRINEERLILSNASNTTITFQKK